MKSAEQIEQSIRRLDVQTPSAKRERTLRDLVEAHKQHQKQTPPDWRSLGRVIMKRQPMKIAAVAALAVLLIGAFSLGGGSAAFSQARHVVSSSLLRLQEMILQIRTGAPTAEMPWSPAPPIEAEEHAPAPDPRAVMCAARFLKIAADDEAIGQALKEQGIELVQASASPETWYATLRREQAEAIESALTVESRTSPRVIVLEGEVAMIATEVFGLAWLPRASNDEQQIESTFSFHDGQNGFEIPSVSVEDGGVILIRAKGILPTGEDFLILLEVGYAPES